MTPFKRVVLFLVDGMRPDGLRAADTPFIDELTSRGVYTYRARSVFPTTTLPCHVSLFHSIPPEVHGVRNNTWQPLPAPVPGLTDVVAQSGLTAAAFYNWEELRDISRPGSLAASFYLKDVPDDGGQTDRDIAALAAAWLQAHDWSFAFVYLHNTDKNGHRSGWMSDAYLAAIGNADRCIRGGDRHQRPRRAREHAPQRSRGGHDHPVCPQRARGPAGAGDERRLRDPGRRAHGREPARADRARGVGRAAARARRPLTCGA